MALTPMLPAASISGESASEAAARQAAALERMTLTEVVPGVLHLKFPSRVMMGRTMVRFQEHYESPKYRNKVFTRTEFEAWYAAQKEHGRYSYDRDWEGFNVPSRVLRRFKRGDFDPLDARERALLAKVADQRGRFYLIATAGKDGDPETLRHEVAHGLWYTRPEYRRRAQALLRGVNLKPVFKMLEKLGYHESVWLDEAHAWLGDDARYVREQGLNPKPYAAVRRKLRLLQKDFVSGVF